MVLYALLKEVKLRFLLFLRSGGKPVIRERNRSICPHCLQGMVALRLAQSKSRNVRPAVLSCAWLSSNSVLPQCEHAATSLEGLHHPGLYGAARKKAPASRTFRWLGKRARFGFTQAWSARSAWLQASSFATWRSALPSWPRAHRRKRPGRRRTPQRPREARPRRRPLRASAERSCR